MAKSRDGRYAELVLSRISVCRQYKPKFGQRSPVDLRSFHRLYGSDSFYHWFGLDNPLLYAAHRAAGGITSLYRQIGLGCEHLFRAVVRDELGLSDEQSRWSYEVVTPSGRSRRLSLDARIDLSHVSDASARHRVNGWLSGACDRIEVAPEIANSLRGSVFEVRQGYKSKDSKRQNADVANAGSAYKHAYLPVVAVLSNQIDADVADRYGHAGWLLLRGVLGGDEFTSIYTFAKDVLGYDLADFFERHADEFRDAVVDVLDTLLSSSEKEAP